MFSHTGLELVESGAMKLEKAPAEQIVVTNGSSWKCPTYVRKLPPCRFECPSSEDIRGYLTQIAQAEKFKRGLNESLDEAWRILTDKNPLPSVHGRICPHPCEGACNRKNKPDGAVAINNMERFIGDHGLRRGLKLVKLTDKVRDEKIAVIGSGPSGLSCAYQLVRRGYQVTMFEAYPEPGGMLRYGIPPYRLPKDVLSAEIRSILDLGVELKLDTKVGVDIEFGKIREEYDAVYLSAGAHKGAGLGVPGEDSANVFTAAGYLNRVNSGARVDIGSNVVVIGGGDSAIDAARASLRVALADEDEETRQAGREKADETDSVGKAALDSARISGRMGATVTIIYRRTREEMPAIDRDISEAEEEGVKIVYLSAPVEIIKEDGRATAVRFARMKLGEPDSSGRRRPVPVEGSEFVIGADSVIVGIGQKPDLPGDMGGLVGQNGWVKVNNNTMQTDVEGIFAGGDVVGLGISTRSVGEGRKAAKSISAYLSGAKLKAPRRARVVTQKSLLPGWYPSAPMNEGVSLGAGERGHDFKEITGTITHEQAVAEAGRCMSCGLCFACDQCRVYCPREAISRDIKMPQGFVMFTDYTKCNGCHICAEVCPCGYIEMGMGL